MSKYLDKGKIEQAFKVAARAAVSGSRDARSGRFTMSKDKAKPGTTIGRRRKAK
jgi:hypothetical protein